jgi:hypothetical protein
MSGRVFSGFVVSDFNGTTPTILQKWSFITVTEWAAFNQTNPSWSDLFLVDRPNFPMPQEFSFFYKPVGSKRTYFLRGKLIEPNQEEPETQVGHELV